MALDESTATATIEEEVAPSDTSEPADSLIVDSPAKVANEAPCESAIAVDSVDAIAPSATPSILIRKAAPPPADPPQPAEPVVRRNFVVRIAGLLLWPIVAILTIMDTPFGGLGGGLKTIIGMVAVATSIIAAATWGAVLLNPHH
jgi:hypothetical protein